MKAKIFLSTGEVSGDYHGAALIGALQEAAARRHWQLEIWALGGDRMAAAGAHLLGHTLHIGSIGLVEALPYVWSTFQQQRRAKRWLRENPPDLMVAIDYVTPNLAMGYFAKRQLKIPVAYYIAPQEWVWSFGDKNTRAIAGFTDAIFAIFPEEARYYRQYGGKVVWVGHPFLDLLADVPDRPTARAQLGIPEHETAIVLLPASRQQEIRYLAPVLMQAAQLLRERLAGPVSFWLPLSLPRYRPALTALAAQAGLPIHIVEVPSQIAIRAGDLVLAKSGTVNLETALLGTPQVVAYRVSPITAWLARKVLKFSIPFMSPPNLVNRQAIVPEFLQEAATPEAIAQCGWELLQNPQWRQQMLADYAEMRAALGEPGVLARVAAGLLDMVEKHAKETT
ncbi:MAG: lipid-A-disaccharide synthase [Pseudanabaenaceae cyanobacterium]